MAWLKYDEVLKVKQTRVLPGEICKHSSLLMALLDAQENLCFARATVKGAFLELLKDNGHSATEVQDSEWVLTVTGRLCNMLRAVSQTAKKAKPSGWCQNEPWFERLRSAPAAEQQAPE